MLTSLSVKSKWQHHTDQYRVLPLGGEQRQHTWRGHDLKKVTQFKMQGESL